MSAETTPVLPRPVALRTGFPGGASGKEHTRHRRCGFDPWVGKVPWRRKWQPTPVFLPGKSHGQRSLADHSQGERGVSQKSQTLLSVQAAEKR